MLAIVAHENMKLGDNTLNNKRLSLVNTKFLTKYLRIVALILLPYNISITLKLKGHIGGRLISRLLTFKKNLSSGSKIIGLFVKADRNVCKSANTSASMHANQILLSSNRLAIGYLHNLSHTFLKRLKLLWGEIACQNASFSKETAEHQDCPFLTVFFLTIKTSSRNISITLLQMPLINFTNNEAAIFGKKLLFL